MPEPRAAREPGDIDVRRVLQVAALLVVVIALTLAVCWQLLQWWLGAPGAAGEGRPRLPAAALAVEASAPQQARDAYFEEKRRLLDSWQWLDRQAGTARIPIDVAIDVLATRAQERRP